MSCECSRTLWWVLSSFSTDPQVTSPALALDAPPLRTERASSSPSSAGPATLPRLAPHIAPASRVPAAPDLCASVLNSGQSSSDSALPRQPIVCARASLLHDYWTVCSGHTPSFQGGSWEGAGDTRRILSGPRSQGATNKAVAAATVPERPQNASRQGWWTLVTWLPVRVPRV